jgi:hypothetical protein
VPPEVRPIGSEFHWDPAALLDEERGGGLLPERRELFATGCGAMTSLLRRIGARGRLHLPSYFCIGVASALSEEMPISWYRHLPDGCGPRWGTLRAVAGDVVVAQNLFGHEDGEPWRAWIAAHPGVTVLEDHSHDPFSAWARHSTAAYAVASLRKTLPVPDGGLLWSPIGLDLPRPSGSSSQGSHLKFAGMVLKAAWLAGRAVPKEGFRELQQRGERELLGSAGSVSALTAAILPVLDVAGLRTASSRQARALIEALPAATRGWRVLDGPGAAPFRVQLVCSSEGVRDALLAHLVRNEIYAPVHWRQDRSGFWSGDEESADLATRMLTIPVDHRCEAGDVRRIVGVLEAFRALLAD